MSPGNSLAGWDLPQSRENGEKSARLDGREGRMLQNEGNLPDPREKCEIFPQACLRSATFPAASHLNK
jgi:hypothetical protein